MMTLLNHICSVKNKARIRMKIPSCMITDEMKLIENYQIYAKVFGVDVPITQSQPIESTQGTHRTPSIPKTPNPEVSKGESSAQQKSTVIKLHIPQRQSTRLTPLTPITTAAENIEKVKENLAAKEIEKMVEGTENVDADEFVNSILNSQNDPGTRLDPGSYKESPEVEITAIVQPVNVIEEEDESVEDDYELKRREKRKHKEHENLRAEVTSQINNARYNHIHSQVDSAVRSYMSNHVLHVHPTQASKASAQEQHYQLYQTMKDDLRLQQANLPIWLALKIKFEGLTANNTPCRSSVIRPRNQDDHLDDAHPERENSAKRQKISEHGTYVIRESSSGQVDKSDPSPSTSGNQEQLDDFDFWTDKYAIDDDGLPAEKVLQELVKEMSETEDEAKLRKESRKEILSSPYPQKHTLVVQSCQRDPKAPALSLVNQDLLNLKKGNSGSKKYALSVHKFLAVIFPDDDIEERTSRLVEKYVKKLNPYARYSVEHWKNPHGKIYYIKRQQEPGKPIEEVY
nr:hypothetical protein [Tanacetum cinerariifolium]